MHQAHVLLTCACAYSPNTVRKASCCRATPHFQQLRKRIDDVITQDYGAALEYAAIFEEHRKVYDFGRSWNFDSYSGKKK